MHALAISCALFAVTSTVRDGTVIVLENSNAVVETYTGSEVTHVGLIVNEGGTVWVYEAAPAAVRSR